MERQVLDPIHLPCPDMAGCVNPDPKLTQNSIAWVQKLRAQFATPSPKQTQTRIPTRFLSACKYDQAKAIGHEVAGISL